MPLTTTLRDWVIRGLIAGLVAGVAAGLVAYFFGEVYIDHAIAIEEAQAAAEAAHGHAVHDEAPLFTRAEQKGGLILATSLIGLAIGAVFGCVMSWMARNRTLTTGGLFGVALSGWAAIVAVPFFKYPGNPPAVGDPDTINTRTALWFGIVVLGVIASYLAWFVADRLAAQALATRAAGAIGTFAAITTAAYLLLPDVSEVPNDFPATLLWDFRVASLLTQTTLWLALGLAFAVLTEYSMRSEPKNRTSAAS